MMNIYKFNKNYKLLCFSIFIILMAGLSIAMGKNKADLLAGVDNWPVGKGENAVWIDSNKDNYFIAKYKINLDTEQPITKLADPNRTQRNVSTLEVIKWN